MSSCMGFTLQPLLISTFAGLGLRSCSSDQMNFSFKEPEDPYLIAMTPDRSNVVDQSINALEPLTLNFLTV